jgi:hypothetical protein
MVRAQRSLMRVVSHWGICSDPLQLKYSSVVYLRGEYHWCSEVSNEYPSELEWGEERRASEQGLGRGCCGEWRLCCGPFNGWIMDE